MFVMRCWFALRVWRTAERLRADRAAHQREGRWTHLTGYVFWLLLAAVVLRGCKGSISEPFEHGQVAEKCSLKAGC